MSRKKEIEPRPREWILKVSPVASGIDRKTYTKRLMNCYDIADVMGKAATTLGDKEYEILETCRTPNYEIILRPRMPKDEI